MRVEGEDVRPVEVGIFDLDIPGYDGGKDFICVGLPEYLQGGLCIDSWLTHREQEAKEFNSRVEVIAHLLKRLLYLDD